jgi:hypothetical protein
MNISPGEMPAVTCQKFFISFFKGLQACRPESPAGNASVIRHKKALLHDKEGGVLSQLLWRDRFANLSLQVFFFI